MKALFVTTHTNDTHNHIDAWDSVSPVPAKRIYFNYRNGVGTNSYIRDKAKEAGDVDVIFYIGCNRGEGLPSYDTLRQLRKIAPVINVISDAADQPWHSIIRQYREEECFDLHVGIDGEKSSPVDLVTLTPVDGRQFDSVTTSKDIRCGFSGNASGKRGQILGMVGSRCLVRVRGDDYFDHIRFMKRCKMVLNIAYTGTGNRFHVKGRVVEAGYAGVALIEPTSSPAYDWFPQSSYFAYKSMEHLIDIIDNTSDEEITKRSAALSGIVREKYNAAEIYGGMLDAINVANPFQRKTA